MAVLLGALGGLAMAAVAGARRTQSSYGVYLQSTNTPDLVGVTAVVNPLLGSRVGYDAGAVRRIAALPHVTATLSEVGINVLLLRHGGPYPFPLQPFSAGDGIGLVNTSPLRGFSIVSGRMLNPRNPDEVLVQLQVARSTHWSVGDRLTFGAYTNAETDSPAFGTAKVRPVRVVTVRIVGIVELATQVIEDDVDFTAESAIFSPAFTDPLVGCCVNYTETGVRLSSPAASSEVSRSIARLIPRGIPAAQPKSVPELKADLALRPLSLALGVFGLIVAVAALIIGTQVIGRTLRASDAERRVLRSLGAAPRTVVATELTGVLGSIALGAALALGVAVALSPLAPIGPVRPFYPSLGVSLDGPVLFIGVASLVVVLGAVAVALELALAPHRVARRRRRRPLVRSRLTTAASTGLSAPAAAGVHFALEPGAGTSRVPVRSVMVAGVLSVLVLVSTVTFGASLDYLVAHPRLYGWNWNYLLDVGTGAGDAPAGAAHRILHADRYVARWSGVYFASLQLDGRSVPVLGERPGAPVQPPLVEGHGLRAADQVVLAPGTLAQLRAHVGGTVTVVGTGAVGSSPPVRLRVVGVATFPAVGTSGVSHLEMGTGALVDDALIPTAAKNPFHDPATGPEGILVRLRAGAGRAGARSLDVVARGLSNQYNFGVVRVSVLHPAEIVNYRGATTTPAVLGGALGAGVIAALLLTLLASVRVRRRDLALLKALGFRRRDLTTAIVVQSTVAVVVSVLVGVPLGVVAGRELWDVFAHEIFAVPSPSVPVAVVALIGVGAIVVADLVAVVPGWRAARTPAAVALRAE